MNSVTPPNENENNNNNFQGEKKNFPTNLESLSPQSISNQERSRKKCPFACRFSWKEQAESYYYIEIILRRRKGR